MIDSNTANYLDRCEADWDQWQRKAATIGRSPPTPPPLARSAQETALHVGRTFKKKGEPWEPRSDSDLIELYEFYKQQRAAASAHINRLKHLRESLIQGFHQRRRISPEELRRMAKLAKQMTLQMRSAELGEGYFAREEARFLQKLQARGHYPHAVASRLPFSVEETRMIGDILRTAEAVTEMVPLTGMEIDHHIQEQQKDLDIATYELKHLRARLRWYQKRLNRTGKLWRLAKKRGVKNLQRYYDLDLTLRRRIHETRQEINRQRVKQATAKQELEKFKPPYKQSRASLDSGAFAGKSLKERWRAWREKRRERKLRRQVDKSQKGRKKRQSQQQRIKRDISKQRGGIKKDQRDIEKRRRAIKQLEQKQRKL